MITYAPLRTFIEAYCQPPPAEWTHFAGIFEEKRVARGGFLSVAGEPARHVGFCASGLLRGYYVKAKGARFIRMFYAEGLPVGAYGSLITGGPASLTIEAIEDSDLLVAEWPKFQKLYERHGCWQELGRKIAEANYLMKERREYQLLMLDATERYLAFEADFGHLRTRITQADIASYLGITPVSLSRIVRGLKKP